MASPSETWTGTSASWSDVRNEPSTRSARPQRKTRTNGSQTFTTLITFASVDGRLPMTAASLREGT